MDKKEKYLIDKFQNAHLEPHRENREIRKNRAKLKKERSKYLRRKGKEELDLNMDE